MVSGNSAESMNESSDGFLMRVPARMHDLVECVHLKQHVTLFSY